jgi:hypothetical protein
MLLPGSRNDHVRGALAAAGIVAGQPVQFRQALFPAATAGLRSGRKSGFALTYGTRALPGRHGRAP